MRNFTLEISYSQIAVFNAGMDRPFNNWTEDHFHQGFVWRPQSVSFRTASKTGIAQISAERTTDFRLRDDAVVAISVPFYLAESRVEVASVFKGEIFDLEPGDYELVFQTGRTNGSPWISLEFVPRKVETALILKGIEHLKPPTPLLMDGEPA